jgi:hypothetical protein
MYSGITTSLTEFYDKLIHTHDLFLANLLASRVHDTPKREDAFAKISLAMVGYKEPSAAEPKKQDAEQVRRLGTQ